MNMNQCLHCLTLFTPKNNSKEHVFPQSIGGSIKIRNVFCVECNGKLGELYDTKLADNFHLFRTLFQVYRDYKRPHPGYKLDTKDSPLISYVNNEGKLAFQTGKYYVSPSEAIVLQESVEKLEIELEKIKKKNPSLSVSTNTKDSDELYDFQKLSAKLCFATGDKDVSFSIMKTALTSYLYLGADRDLITHFPDVFHPNLYPSRLVSPIGISKLYPEKSTDMNLSHSVKIVFSSEKRAILAIIELFNTFQYSVILSNKYVGQNQELDLSQNAITGKKNECKLNFSNEEFLNFLSAPREDQEKCILNSWQDLRELTHLKMIKAGLGKKIGNNPYGIDPDEVLSEDHVSLLFPKFDFVERKEFVL